MRRFLTLMAVLALSAACGKQEKVYQNDLHPTAAPLVSVDPYFSIWSFGPELLRAAVQKSSNVLPTRSIYCFECGPVTLRATFTSPLLLDDLELLSRPVSYAGFDAESNDGKAHEVQLYFEASPRIAIDFDMVPVIAETGSADGIDYARTETETPRSHQMRGRSVVGGFFMKMYSDKVLNH